VNLKIYNNTLLQTGQIEIKVRNGISINNSIHTVDVWCFRTKNDFQYKCRMLLVGENKNREFYISKSDETTFGAIEKCLQAINEKQAA
jgi:hypothetical protein